MPIIKVERPSRRQHTDDADDYLVPAHLEDYYAQAPGLSDQAKLDYYRNPPRQTTLHPTLPGAGDELEQLVDVPLELVEHRHKLQRATLAYDADQVKQNMRKQTGTCALCGHEEWPAAQLAQVDTGSRTLLLCRGDCHDAVAAEVNRRRWADRINQLLDD